MVPVHAPQRARALRLWAAARKHWPERPGAQIDDKMEMIAGTRPKSEKARAIKVTSVVRLAASQTVHLRRQVRFEGLEPGRRRYAHPCCAGDGRLLHARPA